ncbi:MAG TPA: hypothetical protein VF255_07135 [Solirubrobacterales bacterium]
MPDRNRSEDLPFSGKNEPPLQRALLEFLLAEWPEYYSFRSLIEKGGFGDHDRRALLAAIKSLHIGCLIVFNQEGAMTASSMSHHIHWLMTEVEPDAG